MRCNNIIVGLDLKGLFQPLSFCDSCCLHIPTPRGVLTKDGDSVTKLWLGEARPALLQTQPVTGFAVNTHPWHQTLGERESTATAVQGNARGMGAPSPGAACAPIAA